jgi:hypothetical protein
MAGPRNPAQKSAFERLHDRRNKLAIAGKMQTEDVYVAAYSDEKMLKEKEEQRSELQQKVEDARNEASILLIIFNRNESLNLV